VFGNFILWLAICSGLLWSGYWAVFNAAFYLGVDLAILVLHELGHFLAAQALMFEVLRVNLGGGAEFWRSRREGVTWILRWGKRSGHVVTLAPDPHDWQSWSLVLLAGPLGNLFLAMSTWVVLGCPNPGSFLVTLISGPAPGVVFVLGNLWQFLDAMWINERAAYPKDGWHLRQAWRNRHKIVPQKTWQVGRAAAYSAEDLRLQELACYQAVTELEPHNAELLNGQAACLVGLSQYEQARALARKAFHLAGTPLSRLFSLRNFAVPSVMVGKDWSLAEKAAREALAMVPNSPEALFCLGACLMAKDSAGEARPLLVRSLWAESDRAAVIRTLTFLERESGLRGEEVEQRRYQDLLRIL
jgi:tetratricopeptide (TPR) repeat protein